MIMSFNMRKIFDMVIDLKIERKRLNRSRMSRELVQIRTHGSWLYRLWNHMEHNVTCPQLYHTHWNMIKLVAFHAYIRIIICLHVHCCILYIKINSYIHIIICICVHCDILYIIIYGSYIMNITNRSMILILYYYIIYVDNAEKWQSYTSHTLETSQISSIGVHLYNIECC